MADGSAYVSFAWGWAFFSGATDGDGTAFSPDRLSPHLIIEGRKRWALRSLHRLLKMGVQLRAASYVYRAVST